MNGSTTLLVFSERVAMRPPLTLWLVFLSLAILATFAAMIASLLALFLVAVRRERILPAVLETPRWVPWGWPSVAAVALTYLAVQVIVVSTYTEWKQFHERTGTHPAVPALRQLARSAGPARSTPGPADRPEPRPSKVSTEAASAGKAAGSFTEMMALVSVVNAVLIAAVPVLLRLTSGATLDDLGLTRGPWIRSLGLGFGAFLVVTPVVILINLLALRIWSPNSHPLEGMLREGLTARGIGLAYLSAAVLAPVAEELLFRGVIQAWLNRLGLSRVKTHVDRPVAASEWPALGSDRTSPNDVALAARPVAIRLVPALPGFGPRSGNRRSSLPIVLTSLVFAAAHFQQMPAPIAIFFLSLALGWLYEATGSLVAPIVLHGAFNAFNTTLMVFALTALAPTQKNLKALEPPPPAVERNRVEKSGFRLAPRGSAGSVPKDLG